MTAPLMFIHHRCEIYMAEVKMVQIDMPMPKDCNGCPFNAPYVRSGGMDGWNVAPVCLITGKSDEACPLCEIREGKT